MRKNNNKSLCGTRSCGLRISRRCIGDPDLDVFACTIPPINKTFPKAQEELRERGLVLHEIYEHLLRCEKLQDRVIEAIEKLRLRFPALETSSIVTARSAIKALIEKASSPAKPKSFAFDEKSTDVIQQYQL